MENNDVWFKSSKTANVRKHSASETSRKLLKLLIIAVDRVFSPQAARYSVRLLIVHSPDAYSSKAILMSGARPTVRVVEADPTGTGLELLPTDLKMANGRY